MSDDLFNGGMKRSAKISKCGTYRWLLSREWAQGKSVCWIMLNPSTADGRNDDPTLKRLIKFSQLWGFGRLDVVNLYPYRSPSPSECKRWADWENQGPDWYTRDVIFFHNLPIVIETAEAADLVVAAWGAAPWAREFADHVIDELGCSLHCIGATSNGDPKHPLARGKHRVPDDQQPFVWRDYP